MSFPTTFPNSPQGYSFGCTAYGNRHAAFEYGGNLWAFVTQDGPSNNADPVPDYRCHAMMSSDAGLTWTEQDAAHAVGNPLGASPDFTNIPGSGSTGTRGPMYSVAVDGSTALIFSVQLDNIYPPFTSIARNQLIKFDLTTKLWNNSYINPSTVVGIQLNGTNPTSTSVGTSYAQLIVLGPNNYVLFHSTTPQTISSQGWSRMAYTRFDGTTMGSTVNLPGQAGSSFDYWPIDAVLDENGIIQLAYQTRGFGIPSTFTIGLDTGSWTFGTAQGVLTANNYWENQYNTTTSTTSKLITYTPSGGTQKYGFVLETNSPSGGNPQTLSFFHADVALNPTWQQTDITSGNDVTTSLSGTSTINLFPIPQITGGASNATVDLSEKNGTIVVAWNYVRQDAHQTGFIIYVTAPSNTLVFTSPAVLFATGPVVDGSGDTSAISATTFPMTGGIGVLSNAQDIFGFGSGQGGEVMQFYFISLMSTPVITCPVDGGTGVLGAVYDKFLTVVGGTGPYTYALVSGSLPTGLSLNTSTGEISGTILSVGTYNPVYQVTDSLGAISDPMTCPVVVPGGNRPARKCVPQT